MYNQKLYLAIAAEFLQRKYRSIVIIFGIVFMLLIVSFVWLLSLSYWWLLVAIPVIGLLLVGGLLLVVSRIILRSIQPQISSEQSSAVSMFVDKLQRVADNLQTPPIVVMFYVIKDIIRPSDSTYIGSVINDSRTLKSEFQSLQTKFK